MSDQISPSPDLSDWVDQWERARDPSHFKQPTVEEWREKFGAARLRWVEHRIVPYCLEFDWWVRQAGCSESTTAALAELASAASPRVRSSLGLVKRLDSSRRVKLRNRCWSYGRSLNYPQILANFRAIQTERSSIKGRWVRARSKWLTGCNPNNRTVPNVFLLTNWFRLPQCSSHFHRWSHSSPVF
jgi:hypothetical protein